MSMKPMQLGGLIAAMLAIILCTDSACAQQHPSELGESSLRPGDVVRLWVFREEQYTGDFTVSQNGTVVLPKIGAVDASAMTPEQLRTFIMSELSKTLRDPAIDIKLLRRITVLGAVQRPSVVLVDETMTVAHALSLAGGATSTGKPDQVELYRGDEKIVGEIHGATSLTDLPLQSGDQLFVPERSWISRNVGLVSTAVSATLTIVALIVNR